MASPSRTKPSFSWTRSDAGIIAHRAAVDRILAGDLEHVRDEGARGFGHEALAPIRLPEPVTDCVAALRLGRARRLDGRIDHADQCVIVRDDRRDDGRVRLGAKADECPRVFAPIGPGRRAEKPQNIPMRDQLENARIVVRAKRTQDEARGADDVVGR